MKKGSNENVGAMSHVFCFFLGLRVQNISPPTSDTGALAKENHFPGPLHSVPCWQTRE